MDELFTTYSDLFEEVYGFRPCHQMTITEVIEALPKLRKQVEELQEQPV